MYTPNFSRMDGPDPCKWVFVYQSHHHQECPLYTVFFTPHVRMLLAICLPSSSFDLMS